MNCGLCKKPIRGDEHYVTDHYKCSDDLAQLFHGDIDELLTALKAAVETIRVWHSIHDANDTAWEIYRQHAPEMKPLFAAIAKAEGR